PWTLESQPPLNPVHRYVRGRQLAFALNNAHPRLTTLRADADRRGAAAHAGGWHAPPAAGDQPRRPRPPRTLRGRLRLGRDRLVADRARRQLDPVPRHHIWAGS